MAKKIIIEIATDGKVTIEAQGYKGKSCQDATEFLTKALGGKQTEKLTGDYYKTDVKTGQQLKQG